MRVDKWKMAFSSTPRSRAAPQNLAVELARVVAQVDDRETLRPAQRACGHLWPGHCVFDLPVDFGPLQRGAQRRGVAHNLGERSRLPTEVRLDRPPFEGGLGGRGEDKVHTPVLG